MSHYYTNIQGWLQEPSQELPSCSPYITLNKNTRENISKILAKNIHQFLEMHQKMNPKQHGFCSGRSSVSRLLEHQYKILEELKKSNNVDVIYLDFAKVFDKVDHGILFNKLKKIGINGKSVCGYTIFYQTDNNLLLSMEEHQVKLK